MAAYVRLIAHYDEGKKRSYKSSLPLGLGIYCKCIGACTLCAFSEVVFQGKGVMTYQYIVQCRLNLLDTLSVNTATPSKKQFNCNSTTFD